MILQPTAPMRRSTDINDAINLFKKNRCDSVISVCSVGGNHPARVKYLNKKIYNRPDIFRKKRGSK